MANVLITGASGLIGGYFTDNLDVSGKIVTLARGGFQNQGRDTTNQIYRDLSQISVSDIRKIYDKHEISHVIHCAAIKKVTSDAHHEFNRNAIEKFLLADDKKDIHFIVMGSISECGIVETGTIEESMTCNPTGRYALSKLEQTKLCEAYFKKGHKINVIRLTNPIMPELPETTFIGAILSSLKKSESLVMNDESIERDFVDGRDLKDFIAGLIKAPYVSQIVVNFASGRNRSYKYCIERVNYILSKFEFKKNLEHRVLSKNENYSKAIVSTDILRDTFKFKSRYTLDDSLEWVIKSANLYSKV